VILNPTTRQNRLLNWPHCRRDSSFRGGRVVHVEHLPDKWRIESRKKWCEEAAFHLLLQNVAHVIRLVPGPAPGSQPTRALKRRISILPALRHSVARQLQPNACSPEICRYWCSRSIGADPCKFGYCSLHAAIQLVNINRLIRSRGKWSSQACRGPRDTKRGEPYAEEDAQEHLLSTGRKLSYDLQRIALRTPRRLC